MSKPAGGAMGSNPRLVRIDIAAKSAGGGPSLAG